LTAYDDDDYDVVVVVVDHDGYDDSFDVDDDHVQSVGCGYY